MLRSRALGIGIGIAAAFTVACGKGRNGDPVANVKVASMDKDLQHTFQSDCSLSPFEALFSGLSTGLGQVVKSSRTQYVFTGANYDRKTIFYLNPDCTQEAYIFSEQGSFTINPDNRTNENAKQIDMRSEKLTLAALTGPGVEAANAMKLCSIADWTAGSERDVTDKSREANCYWAKVPRSDYNIYRVDAGRLMLGSDSKAERKPEQRPVELNSAVYRQK